MLPETVPMVQLKLLGIFAVRGTFRVLPLQTDAVERIVITGAGKTVTVTVNTFPEQVPEPETGMTRYSTVPFVVPGLVSVWDIVDPVPAVAPVMPPVIFPIV
jgi:hypothetical protein